MSQPDALRCRRNAVGVKLLPPDPLPHGLRPFASRN